MPENGAQNQVEQIPVRDIGEENQQVNINSPSTVNQLPVDKSTPLGSQASSPLTTSPNFSPSQLQRDNVRRSTRQQNTQYDPFAFDKGFENAAQKAKTEMDADLDQNGRKEVFQAPKIFEPRSYREAIKCLD